MGRSLNVRVKHPGTEVQARGRFEASDWICGSGYVGFSYPEYFPRVKGCIIWWLFHKATKFCLIVQAFKVFEK